MINQTQKERFNQRLAQRFKDADINDEDIYYENANKLMDDYETYETATGNLLQAIDGNELFMDMITQACTQDDFDPIVWMIQQGGFDIQEIVNNPNYADAITKAHSRYIEQEAEQREIDKQMKANLPKSIEEIKNFCQQENIDDDKMNEIVADMWQLGENMVKGVLPIEVFQIFYKAKDYDEKLKDAYEQGKQDGVNIKIDEHLKNVRAATQSTIPTQTPVNIDRKKLNKSKNPFIDSDWA